jgi:hypothetical protein
MDIELKKALHIYREITIRLIEELERENYDGLEVLLSERQVQIDRIDKIEHSKEEFLNICKEYQILMLQEKLTKLMSVKKAYARDELNNFNKGKSANISYRNKGNIDSFYFNKKI